MHIKDNFELETGTTFKNRLCKAAMTEGIAKAFAIKGI
jgi:2,4-dienoyl-CoA reductase-like NADH-dependent reductase (Old Yellow Enzyme family)